MTNLSVTRSIAPRVLLNRSPLGRFNLYLALLLLGLCTNLANAQTPTPAGPPLTYNDGDLFLGFRATDGTSDYLVNIGQPGQFVSAAPGSTIPVSLVGVSADLVAAFGTDWCTRIDPNTGVNAVLWAVMGGRQVAASGDPANTLYSTNPLASPWSRRSDTAQSFSSSLISALGNTFAGNNPTSNNPQGLIQSAAGSNSYASFQPGGANSGGVSFQAWNPSDEGAPNSSLFFDRIVPGSGSSTVLGSFLLDCSGQLTFTASVVPTPTPTPTPPVTANISGTVSYCNNPALPTSNGVLMTLSGSSGGTTTTASGGAYSFLGLATGGSYTITPSKTARTPGSAGINTLDVVAVQKHFLGTTLLTGCRLTAANVSPPAAINTLDVIAVQHFFLGQTAGIGNAGKYQFSPATRTYSLLASNQTGQNFDELILGDCAGPFVSPPRPGGPGLDAFGGDSVSIELPSNVSAVELPEVEVDRSLTDFVTAVTTTAVDPKEKLIGFQGDLTFDERLVTFDREPVQPVGLTASNWNVSGNVLDGPGPIRTLRISAYSNDLTPLNGKGSLFELRMIRVGKTGQGTQLIWAAPPDNFFFIDSDLNIQKPAYAATGGVTISADTRK